MSTSLVSMAKVATELESRILATAEMNGGEVDHELDLFLEEIQTQLSSKADSYKFILDRLRSTSEMLKKQADMFSRAKEQCERVTEQMKTRIKVAMVSMGTDEVRGFCWRFKMSANPKGKLLIDIPMIKRFNPEFVKTETIETEIVDKAAVKKALDGGEQITGADYETTYTLREYTAKE